MSNAVTQKFRTPDLDSLYSSNVPMEFQTIVINGEVVECARTIFGVLNAMSTKSKVGSLLRMGRQGPDATHRGSMH